MMCNCCKVEQFEFVYDDLEVWIVMLEEEEELVVICFDFDGEDIMCILVLSLGCEVGVVY